MALQRWYPPFADVRWMEEGLNRLWSGFYGREAPHDGVKSWVAPLDVEQDGEKIVVSASLPGARPEDINVTIEDGILIIRAQTASEEESKEGKYLMRERRSGSFYRSLRLPDTVDAEKAESQHENGVLTLTFPKQEAKKARQIEVKVRS